MKRGLYNLGVFIVANWGETKMQGRIDGKENARLGEENSRLTKNKAHKANDASS